MLTRQSTENELKLFASTAQPQLFLPWHAANFFLRAHAISVSGEKTPEQRVQEILVPVWLSFVADKIISLRLTEDRPLH